MILTTTDNIPGFKLEELLNVVISSNKGEDTSMDEALKHLAEEAKKVGADAITGIRFEVSNMRAHTFKVFAYGTAVRAKKE